MERLEERKKRVDRVGVKWVVQLPYGFALTSSTCSLVIRLFPSKPRLSRAKPEAASVLVTIPLTSLAKHLAHLRRQRLLRLATSSLRSGPLRSSLLSRTASFALSSRPFHLLNFTPFFHFDSIFLLSRFSVSRFTIAGLWAALISQQRL